jgi:predicted unusual protein kinase regulating ubiquinone biosynthesis (AarF/ABC1/UbiB family)
VPLFDCTYQLKSVYVHDVVMHPHVEDDIDADIDIMRLTLVVLEMLPFDAFKGIKWLNIPGFIDEMDRMLKIQLDLRTEAKNLERFNENFKGNELVIIPKVGYGGKLILSDHGEWHVGAAD